jgi:hypothetical protein
VAAYELENRRVCIVCGICHAEAREHQ